MYSIVQFDDMDTLIDHKVELEQIFKDRLRYTVKFDIEETDKYYVLRTKIATICPN
jgi:hypothetical protein